MLIPYGLEAFDSSSSTDGMALGSTPEVSIDSMDGVSAFFTFTLISDTTTGAARLDCYFFAGGLDFVLLLAERCLLSTSSSELSELDASKACL